MDVDDLPLSVLMFAILATMVLSAYFSGTETAMMSLNRYRLRHLVKNGHRGARKVNRLLRRPDRLLGVILIGNNLVNNAAASLATVIGIRLLGDVGVALAPVVITILFLMFSEVAPKTLAAHYPERVAFPSAYVLTPLLRLFYPVVWAVNGVVNWLLKPFAIDQQSATHDRLSIEELRTVLNEGARLPIRRQNMLLSILDLEKVTVDDIMVTRADIVGIDLEDSIQSIVAQVCSAQHTRLPVYRRDINNVVGILHLRNALRFISDDNPTHAGLQRLTREPYFVPQGTALHTQLFNFQRERRRVGLVVDEFGDVIGIVTIEDILEEIVGDFTTDVSAAIPEVHPQPDGSYYIDGLALLRDVNRALDWDLPTDGPKTVNGLVLEHLEFIPESPVCIRIAGYRFETIQLNDNVVRTVRVVPPPRPAAGAEGDDEDHD